MRFRTNDKGFITLRFADFPNTEFELNRYDNGFMTIDLSESSRPPRTPEQREREEALDRVIDGIVRAVRKTSRKAG